MEVWVKFSQADFESNVIQSIVASGECQILRIDSKDYLRILP